VLYVYRYGKPGPYSVTLIVDTRVVCRNRYDYREQVAWAKARLGELYAGSFWHLINQCVPTPV
jgi:hypothetical protein